MIDIYDKPPASWAIVKLPPPLIPIQETCFVKKLGVTTDTLIRIHI